MVNEEPELTHDHCTENRKLVFELLPFRERSKITTELKGNPFSPEWEAETGVATLGNSADDFFHYL